MATTQQRLVIYVPQHDFAQLESLASAQGGRSVTSIVREALTEFLTKSNGPGAPLTEDDARAATKGA